VPETAQIQVRINDRDTVLDVDPLRRMLDVLRDDLQLTGTKEGCGVGVCGACSILLDDAVVAACLLPAGLVDGRTVLTIEGLETGSGLTPLQSAFIDHGGIQCGFCTPGQVIAATALLARRPDPTDAEIDAWMAGNLCRCTGYAGIRRAIRAAAGSPDA
jgi:carbon-monoxide dehydrogenase small subunit